MAMFQWLKQLVHPQTTEDSSRKDHTTSTDRHHHRPSTPPSSPTDHTSGQTEGHTQAVESDRRTQRFQSNSMGQAQSSSSPSITQTVTCEELKDVVHEDSSASQSSDSVSDHLESVRSSDYVSGHLDSVRSSDDVLDHLDSVRSSDYVSVYLDSIKSSDYVSDHLDPLKSSDCVSDHPDSVKSSDNVSDHLDSMRSEDKLLDYQDSVRSSLHSLQQDRHVHSTYGCSEHGVVSHSDVQSTSDYRPHTHIPSLSQTYSSPLSHPLPADASSVSNSTPEPSGSSCESTGVDDFVGDVYTPYYDVGHLTSFLDLDEYLGTVTTPTADDVSDMTSQMYDNRDLTSSTTVESGGMITSTSDDVGSIMSQVADDMRRMTSVLTDDTGRMTSLLTDRTDRTTSALTYDEAHMMASTDDVGCMMPQLTDADVMAITRMMSDDVGGVTSLMSGQVDGRTVDVDQEEDNVDDVEDVVSHKDTTTAGDSSVTAVGGLSPEEKEKRKILNKAAKKLLKVNRRATDALEESGTAARDVQDKVDKVEANRVEVEKALREHVKYLHSLLDYHHQQQEDLLKQRHKDFLTQLMVNRTESLNYESKLKDCQKRVEDTLQRVFKDRDVTAADNSDVTTLCDDFHRVVSSKPSKQDPTLTYLVEIPQVTADDLQSLVGHFIFKDNREPSTQITPYPQPRWPAQKDSPATKTPGSGTGSSSSSQHVDTGPKAGNSTKPPPPKTAAGAPTYASAAARNTATSSKGQKAKAAAKPPAAKVPVEGKSREEVPRSEQPCASSVKPKPGSSAKPKENWACLGSKQKLSETMASCSSIASTSSASDKQGKKRTRSRRRRKEKKTEAEKAAAESLKPAMITLLHEDARPKRIMGRKKEARGFAARPEGELWVVYGDRDPHLDRINEEGKVLESFRIGGNAMGAAVFSNENVLVALHSPTCQLQLLDEQKENRETIKLPLIPTGLGVGSTGIAVASYTCLYWIPLDGSKNEWIVKQKGSPLKNVCACDIIIIQGREIVCVADSDAHKVWFFEKLDNGEFAPLPLFTYASQCTKGKTVPFSPVSLSALAGSSFLAVLDEASRSVIMVDVEKNEAVSVIGNKYLCDGFPSLVTFALTDPGCEPKLWVTSDTQYLYLVSLAFLY